MGLIHRLLLLCSLAMLYVGVQGCAPAVYLEVGAGKNTSISNSVRWDDAGTAAFYGGVRAEWPEVGRFAPMCQYTHYSQWMAGPPFNNDAESSLDHFGCGVRFRITPR